MIVLLLALGSGAIDALSVAALGAVFASVMTGNLVLLGLSAVQARPAPALAAGAAILAYAAGVFAAAARLRRKDPAGEKPWPVLVSGAFVAVLLPQGAVLAGWLSTGGHPGEAVRTVLLALSAFAMGVQSASVNALPIAGAATTYLTGTLTTLTTELATSGVPSTMRLRSAVLTAALAGAGLDAALLTWARPAAPAIPVAATLAVAVIAGRGR